MMFIAQQPGEVHGRIAVSTTAGGTCSFPPTVPVETALLRLVLQILIVATARGVINYEVKGNATANQYRIDPVVHSKVPRQPAGPLSF